VLTLLLSGSSEYPYCRTHVYDDEVFTGYTLLGCAVAAGTDRVAYSSTSSSTTSPSSSPRPSSSASSSTGAPGLAVTGSGTPKASESGSSTTQPARSSAPIGAIVGGVVGGMAVVVLFALGLVLLLRRNRQHKRPSSGPPQDPPQPPAQHNFFQQPHMQHAPPQAQGGYAVAAPVMDNRGSITKPRPVSTAQPAYGPALAAAGSPPPQSQSQSPSPGTIPPAYQATNANAGLAAAAPSTSPTVPETPTLRQQRPESHANPGYPVQVQPAYQQPESHYFEMPTVKSDRELRELA
jgi:hypothetical protein